MVFKSSIGDKEVVVQKIIDEAMKSGVLQQRNVVGVITGLMGAGKTTLLHRLFGMAPPEVYNSTGVAEQSFRGFLHHVVRMSAKGTWKRITYDDICEYLAPLIKAGMTEAKVADLAQKLLRSINSINIKNPMLSAPPTSHLQEHSKAEMSHVTKKFANLVRKVSPADKPKDLVLDLVHMIDTGGQPELMEVMPSLIHNANLVMALVNLEYGLDKCPSPACYNEGGVQYDRQLSSQYITGKDVILKLASTLHAKRSVCKNFRLIIVATHSDCVQDLEAKEEELNQQLSCLLLPAFKNELLMFETPNKIAFVLNLKTPGEHDNEALQLIRDVVSSQNFGSNPFETPASFFAFEQDLLHFSKAVVKRDILTLDECKLVGAKLKMDPKMVVAALVLFHCQNTFLYFPEVLPNHIFINPQIPLDLVNSIVRFSYKTLRGVPVQVSEQLRDGIITEELLGHGEVSPHFIPDIYEIDDAIKLFRHTFTLAPLQSDTPKKGAVNRKKEYLMMCLKPAIPQEELPTNIPKSSDTVPLVIKFSTGCVPLGSFGGTISCLLSDYKWEVVIEDNSPKCLAHNIACLHDRDLRVNVFLVNFIQYIEIHISSDQTHTPLTTARICNQIRRKVLGSVETVIERMALDRNEVEIRPAVVCPYAIETSLHFAEFTKDILWCRKCSQCCEADQKQLLWMGEDPHSQPDLPQLFKMKVPERAGEHYFMFGTLLLDDKIGCIVGNIEKSSRGDPEHIVINILRDWLTRGPTPVTWQYLIETLEKSNLSNLASHIRDWHNIW